MFQTSSKDDAFKRDQYKRFPSIQLILTSKDNYPVFTASSNTNQRSNSVGVSFFLFCRVIGRDGLAGCQITNFADFIMKINFRRN